MPSEIEKYHELSYYTLSHSSPDFIHQHIVDAFAAQQADQGTKPIKLAFALIGLYLYLEKGYSGREVQQAHMRLGKTLKPWPGFPLPVDRGKTTVGDVLAAEPGEQRDAMIHNWCESVWQAYAVSHAQVEALVQKELYPFSE